MFCVGNICVDVPPLDHLPVLYQSIACLCFVMLPLLFGLVMTQFEHDSNRHID